MLFVLALHCLKRQRRSFYVQWWRKTWASIHQTHILFLSRSVDLRGRARGGRTDSLVPAAERWRLSLRECDDRPAPAPAGSLFSRLMPSNLIHVTRATACRSADHTQSRIQSKHVVLHPGSCREAWRAVICAVSRTRYINQLPRS